MKLKEFIENLQDYVKKNPEALELDAVYAIDDEGNGFNSVTNSLIQGMFTGNSEEFICKSHYEASPQDYAGIEFKVNAICIN